MDTIPTQRRGSSVSDRQLGRAAVEGKVITFHVALPGQPFVAGYLVGMDDYHWAVGAKGNEESFIVTLVHRSCPLVSISAEVCLPNEPEDFRSWVTGVGSSFWNTCSKKYLGKPVPSSTNE